MLIQRLSCFSFRNEIGREVGSQYPQEPEKQERVPGRGRTEQDLFSGCYVAWATSFIL